MALPALIAPVVSWIFREVVIKFVVMSSLFALITLLVPVAVNYLTPWLNTGSLSSAFSGIPGSVWFFLDFFAINYGAPLMISAYVTRFLIRRLPVIG